MRHGSLDPRRPPPPPAPGRGRGTSNLPNPGSFDSLHRQCKDVFPVQMEGVKVTVNKELSSHFKASHTVIMSALGLPGYQFSTTYVGSSEWGPVLPGAAGRDGQLGEPQRPMLPPPDGAHPHQGRLPDPARSLRELAAGHGVQGRRLHSHAHAGTPQPPQHVRCSSGALPAERVGGPGAGRGACAAPARRHPRGHPHGRGALHRRELGGHAERWPGRGARQLLPQSQPPGAGGGGVRGEHADARDQLLVRLPTHAAAYQHRVQSVCRQ
ncbi:uncharacterized protein LOC142906282 isoform X3 [Petromyzon marinus]|uniref:uncharacterized protein LOC142906282 isoform X3 n=1 Tax=Petromyzon marinus TaxID=7757 RepID=UPI003F71AC93